MTDPAPTLAAILTDDEVRALRDAYEPDVANTMPIEGMAALVPASRDLVTPLMRDYYVSDDMPHAERELVLVGVTALQGQGMGFNFATHLYWAITAGLEPSRIAQVLLLLGYYAGIPIFNNAAKTAQKVFGLLKQLVAAGTPGTGDVIAALGKAFPI